MVDSDGDSIVDSDDEKDDGGTDEDEGLRRGKARRGRLEREKNMGIKVMMTLERMKGIVGFYRGIGPLQLE